MRRTGGHGWTHWASAEHGMRSGMGPGRAEYSGVGVYEAEGGRERNAARGGIERDGRHTCDRCHRARGSLLILTAGRLARDTGIRESQSLTRKQLAQLRQRLLQSRASIRLCGAEPDARLAIAHGYGHLQGTEVLG